MATYRSEIQYIEKSEPGLIERNAAEFAWMGDLLESVEPTIARAGHIEWESISREAFDARVKEAKSLIETLGYGFRRASFALMEFSDEVELAKKEVAIGMSAYVRLKSLLDAPGMRDLLAYVGLPAGVEYDDPMKQYEKLGAGFRLSFSLHGGLPLPRFSDVTDDAERYYNQADDAFGKAKAIEEPAREECLAKLAAVRAALPDFVNRLGGDFRAAHDLAAGIEALQAEFAEARTDENISLPGAGPRDDFWPTDADGAVSAELGEINRLAAGHAQASESYWSLRPGHEIEWVRNNKELIAEIAARSGIPPEMLAAILVKESNDFILNDGKEVARVLGFISGDRDETSFGPMEIQIRRAADVLGYDPEALTDAQRDQVRAALKDPVRGLYIAAEYLEQLKAGSHFADVPAAEMTDEQYRELAQMYNGGPYWESDDAKAYGLDFEQRSLPAAKGAFL